MITLSITRRNTVIAVVFTLLLTHLAQAQTQKVQCIDVSVGLGLSAPYTESEETDIMGTGFYVQGEYVLNLASWFSVRPYAGLILTSPSKDNERDENRPEYEVTTNAFLIGGKVRVTAPIPYVAPYVEIGLGASIGSFRTFTDFIDIKENGIIYHIPFTLGLAIGRQHTIGLEFTYFHHPSIDQFAGAAAVGITFALN